MRSLPPSEERSTSPGGRADEGKWAALSRPLRELWGERKEDIMRMKMTKDDILHALGLEPRRDTFMDMFLMFGVGMIAGVAVGMLLAPKAGVELRHDVAERAGGLVSGVRSRLSSNMPQQQQPSTP